MKKRILGSKRLKFHIGSQLHSNQVTEYKILAYEASTGNIYPVISNGTVINQPVKKEALPENYMRLNLSDKAKVKKLMQELSDVPDSIKNEIQTVDLTPSKATKDLLTLTMRDEHKIIVPLSDIHKKLPCYSRVHPLLTEPSIVDMEAGIFSYSARSYAKRRTREKRKFRKKLSKVKQRQHRQMLLMKQITKENEEKLSTFANFVL